MREIHCHGCGGFITNPAGSYRLPAPVRDGRHGAATQRAMYLLSVHRLRAAAGVLVVAGVAQHRSPQDGGPQLGRARGGRPALSIHHM